MLASVAGGAAYVLSWYRPRLVRSNADLIALLPEGDATRIFADVALLRRGGVLEMISGSGLNPDPDYLRFEAGTHFNYNKDLDALAGALDGDRMSFLLRGRFDQTRLRKYAVSNGGSCTKDWCRVPTSVLNRSAEFTFVQPDVLALTVGNGGSKHPEFRRSAPQSARSPDPVWVEFSSKALRQPSDLPLPLQIFAVSLQGAHPVILSLNAAGGEEGYQLNLKATFPNSSAASTIRNQLALETKALSLALSRQNHGTDPKDFAGLLASGNFQVSENSLLGHWLIRPELLGSLR